MENEREIAGHFGEKRNKVIRLKPNFRGISTMVFYTTMQPLKNSLQILRLKRIYNKRRKEKLPKIDHLSVAILSDSLDEVNGISNNARQMVTHLRSVNKNISLIGTVSYPANQGKREKNGTILVAQEMSSQMVGYEDSEFAIPSLKEILRLLQRYPVDLIELETPTPGCMIALHVCKFIGIPVISHYRTDVIGYTSILDVGPVGSKWVKYWTMYFTKRTRPIIVPSQDYKKIVAKDMKIDPEDIFIIRRGIKIQNYSPEKRSNNYWEKIYDREGSREIGKTVRFIYVGRVSQEKNLPFLTECWKEFRIKHPQSELMIIGHGPYKKKMEESLEDCPEVRFTGKLSGEQLFSLYAEADFFLFPSGTDTFGNVVVESLASGTPVLVSDKGGPKDIIGEHACGSILAHLDKEAWVNEMDYHYRIFKKHPTQYDALREESFQRGQFFSLNEAGKELWQFYQDLFESGYFNKNEFEHAIGRTIGKTKKRFESRMEKARARLEKIKNNTLQ